MTQRRLLSQLLLPPKRSSTIIIPLPLSLLVEIPNNVVPVAAATAAVAFLFLFIPYLLLLPSVQVQQHQSFATLADRSTGTGILVVQGYRYSFSGYHRIGTRTTTNTVSSSSSSSSSNITPRMYQPLARLALQVPLRPLHAILPTSTTPTTNNRSTTVQVLQLQLFRTAAVTTDRTHSSTSTSSTRTCGGSIIHSRNSCNSATATTTTGRYRYEYQPHRQPLGLYHHRSKYTRTSRLFSSTIDRIMNDERVNNPNHYQPNNNNKNNNNNCSSSSSNNNDGGNDGTATTSIYTDHENNATQSYTDYELWVRRLYATNMFHPVKLGLDNMEQLHAAMDRPIESIPLVVHIAGTNGKGSVAYKIAKTAQYSNNQLKVGLFCSPHVSSFRERMQINDQFITEEEVVQLLPKIYETCKDKDIPATFFEITTMLAFQYFAMQQVDVVVLETGLGGRLDATNIVQKPALSIITSIGLEHTRILGDTIELIAIEKGGIIKKDCPVLVGPNVPHDTLRQCAKDKGASQYYTCDDVLGVKEIDTDAKPDVTQKVDYDIENSRIATAAIQLLQQSHSHVIGSSSSTGSRISDEVILRGTSHRPPCRFEIVQYQHTENSQNPIIVILDVAHNPPAMQYLSYKLQSTYPNRKFRIVVGMSSDKDMSLCSKSLKEIVSNDVSRIHLVEAAHPRAATLEEMWHADNDLQLHAQFNVSDRSITNQIRAAVALMPESTRNGDTENDDEILIVCGSVFLMAEAREALGFQEPRDSRYIAELAGSGVRHSQENFGNRTVL
jgi:dihydrofolate synthase / folylpolyglutamate synthase